MSFRSKDVSEVCQGFCEVLADEVRETAMAGRRRVVQAD